MADLMVIFAAAQTLFDIFSGSQKAEAQAEAGRREQEYYNSLAVAEEKRSIEDVFQVSRKESEITRAAASVEDEQTLAAASAGYEGAGLKALSKSTASQLAIDKTILQQTAQNLIATSREKQRQLRQSGKYALETSSAQSAMTWLDTASSVSSRWIPMMGQGKGEDKK
jgi:hypothetical protein